MESKTEKEKNILFISQELPYKNVPHAGGKTFYYYLSRLIKYYDITLISFCRPDEEGKVGELLELGIEEIHVIPIENSVGGLAKMTRRLLRILRYLLSSENALFHAGSEAIEMKKKINFVSNRDRRFNIIQLEWTSSLVFLDEIRRVFPNIPIVSSLHDFNAIALDRRLTAESNPWRRHLYKKQQEFEIEKIKQCDLVLMHSPADASRVIKAGAAGDKVHWLCPYYTNLDGCALRADKPREKNKTMQLLFFGAMWREENWRSIIEFITNVLYPLRTQGHDIRLTVLGADPPPQLLRFNDANAVHVKGYVDDIKPFFANADLFVAPLIMGGGIKVKVLEAMSAGLPVLGNEIAMEGIDARPGAECFYARNWTEWRKALVNLFSERKYLSRVGESGMLFVQYQFDLEKSFIELLSSYDKHLNGYYVLGG